jgi:hypothetical protein
MVRLYLKVIQTKSCLMKKLFLLTSVLVCLSVVNSLGQTARMDSIAIIINHVKADQRPLFEQFVKELLAGVPKLTVKDQAQFKKMRVLKAVYADKDGTYPYTFVFDPLVSNGGDTDLESLLNKMYGQEKGNAQFKKFVDSTIGEQTQYFYVEQ